MQTKHYRAQIMLMTLVTMMILAIISIGIVANVGRDTKQTVNNQQYEQLFASSEDVLMKVVDKYGKVNAATGTVTSLNSFSTDFPQCTATIPGVAYDNCQDIVGNTTTVFSVKDTSDVTDYELAKDQPFTINLAGYTGELNFRWTGTAAMQFNLVYADAAGVYKSIQDIYDKMNVLTANGGDPLIAGANHPFNFSKFADPDTNSVRFIVGSISGFAGTSVLLSVTPRMSQATTRLTTSTGSGLLAKQFREFTSGSYLAGDSTAPVVRLRTVLPISAQGLSAFEYALLTESTVSKL